MLCSLVAGLVVALGQDARKDYKMPVMPMWQFGEWLGKETDRSVTVLPQVQDRLVYINVKNRTLPELLGFVKQAIGVEVLDKNGVLTLRDATDVARTGSMSLADIQSGIDRWVVADAGEAELRTAIPTLSRINEKRMTRGLSSEDPDWKTMIELSRLEPLSPACGRFVHSLGASGIEKLPDFERVVFSTSPTRLQRAWPGSAGPEMSQITKSMELRNRLVTELIPKRAENEEQLMFGDGYSSLLSAGGGAGDPVSALMATVQKLPYQISFEFKAFNSEGAIIGRFSHQIQGLVGETSAEVQKELEAIKEKYSSAYELTEEEKKEGKRILSLFGGIQGATDFSREDLEWMAQIDENEPFGGLVSRLYDFGLAEFGGEAVMEVLIPLQELGTATKVTAGESLVGLMSHSIFTGGSPNAEKLMIGKPLPSWINQFLMSRRSMAVVASSVLEKQKLSLDDLCLGVSGLSNREQMGVYVPFALTLAAQQAGSSYIEPRGWEEFSLLAYSNLTPQQRKAVFAEGGLELDISQVTPAIRDAFWSTVRTSNKQLQVGYELDPVTNEFKEVPFPEGIPENDWNKELSVFLTYPSALPVKIKLVARSAEGLMVSYSHPMSDGQTFESKGFQSVSQFAQTQTYQEMFPQPNYQPPTLMGVAAANQLSLDLSVKFGAFSLQTTTFTMLNSPMGKIGQEGGLPDSVKKELEEARKKARQDYSRMHGGNPPPP